MALKGIESTKAALRATKLVYWRIFEDARTKTAGSFLATSNFDDPDLTETQSYEELSAALDRLTSGRYILLAYKSNSSKGGAAFESAFEIAPDYRSSSPISGTTSEFIMDGIGKVTPENFEAAIEKKLKMMLDKQAEEKRLADLQAENERLKNELKENEGGINKGLLAIGTIVYPMVSKSPAFKEVFSMVSGVMKQMPSEGRSQQLSGTSLPSAVPAAEHVEGDTCEIGGVAVAQDELFATLDELGTNNPEVLSHLKILAGLKKNNPEMYNQAVEMAKDL